MLFERVRFTTAAFLSSAHERHLEVFNVDRFAETSHDTRYQGSRSAAPAAGFICFLITSIPDVEYGCRKEVDGRERPSTRLSCVVQLCGSDT